MLRRRRRCVASRQAAATGAAIRRGDARMARSHWWLAVGIMALSVSAAPLAQPTALDPAVVAYQLPDQIKWTDNPRAGKDRKSARLNSSHSSISYAVFCLKKKKTRHTRIT